MFVMPVVFSLIFGGMASGGTEKKPIVLLVGGEDELSREILMLIEGNPQYRWLEATEIEALEKVANRDAIAAVMIHENIPSQIKKEMPLFQLVNERQTHEYLALKPVIEGVARTVIRGQELVEVVENVHLSELLANVSERNQVNIDYRVFQKDGENSQEISLMTLGFTIMFMMFGISGAASTILDEKRQGTWQRILTTPATKLQMMIGYLLAYFLMGWIQMAVLMIMMTVIFSAAWGNLVYFILFTSLVIVTIVGFGLMIAGLVKTSQQAGALSAVLIVTTCMLGGVYWSLELVPEFMQKISKVIPQTWMMEGLREIISGSMSTSTLLTAILILIAFSLMFFSIGLKKLKFQ
ncbi:ABC transporter permease subunit [Bacillus sp. B15-48]|nr:ABC transporter permease subunit [Bacillus sp. B15-48]